MGVFRGTARNDHFCNGKAAEDRTNFSVVVVRDGGQYNTLAVAISYMHLPLLPLQHMTFHLERHAFRLNDMQWLQIISFFMIWVCVIHEVGQEVVGCQRRRSSRYGEFDISSAHDGGKTMWKTFLTSESITG